MAGQRGRRVEFVEGTKVEKVEFGLRTVRDGMFHRAGHVEERGSLEYAVQCRERPFSGWKGDEEIVTRTVVTYTTSWTVVPGHEGSLWFSCGHDGTPQGRPLDWMPGRDGLGQGPDYQLPHGYRERDMVADNEGVRRYTCPVCGKTWRHRDTIQADPQGSLF